MPASTRSATKQAKLEDVGAGEKGAQPKSNSSAKTTAAGKKRKVPDAPKEEKPVKYGKTSADEQSADDDDSVLINRAPVLELFASTVTQALYPQASWETCLSAGGAISTIAAISKGRSIGTIGKPDPGEAQAKSEKRKEEADKEELQELDVMSFHLRLKDGHAMVGDKPKKPNEEALRKKYGGEDQYERVRKAFAEGLTSWQGKEEELNSRAFSMYEDFRPSVKPGQAGWGRKGVLSLEKIRSVVEES